MMSFHVLWSTQEQAMRKAANLQQQAAQSAKEGLAGARLVAADISRGDAQRAGSRMGAWVHRASTSAGMLYVARLLVRGRESGCGDSYWLFSLCCRQSACMGRSALCCSVEDCKHSDALAACHCRLPDLSPCGQCLKFRSSAGGHVACPPACLPA